MQVIERKFSVDNRTLFNQNEVIQERNILLSDVRGDSSLEGEYFAESGKVNGVEAEQKKLP